MNNDQLMKAIGYASVSVALTLIVIKTIAWFMTDSMSLMATLLDSIMDVGASLINLWAIKVALTPPDKEHQFGHGKAESLAGIAQSAFICGSALILLLSAIEGLFNPQPVQETTVGLLVMGISILLTLLLVIGQRYVMVKTGSLAVEADSVHYIGDLLINTAVIAALILSDFGIHFADPVFATIIVLVLIKAGVELGIKSVNMLMDRAIPESTQVEIGQHIETFSGVKGFHDLRTRQSGPNLFIQFHLELDRSMTLEKAHGIAEGLEHSLLAAYPRAEIIIHQDPA